MIPYATPADIETLASAVTSRHATPLYYLAHLTSDGPIVEDTDEHWSHIDDARTALADLAREMLDEGIEDEIEEYAIVRGCDAPEIVCRWRDGREVVSEGKVVWP